MFCKYCGKEIDNDSKFCKYCGKSLENNIKTDITLMIYNQVLRKRFSVKISDEKTYSDLFATLIKLNILPSTQISINSAILSDRNYNVIADINTQKDLEEIFIYDEAILVLDYKEYRPERYIPYNPRDMICLYGCPNSNKNKKR